MHELEWAPVTPLAHSWQLVCAWSTGYYFHSRQGRIPEPALLYPIAPPVPHKAERQLLAKGSPVLDLAGQGHGCVCIRLCSEDLAGTCPVSCREEGQRACSCSSQHYCFKRQWEELQKAVLGQCPNPDGSQAPLAPEDLLTSLIP